MTWGRKVISTANNIDPRYIVEHISYDRAHSTTSNFGRIWTHERHPIPRPYGWAMGCVSWVIRREVTAIYRERTVLTKFHDVIDMASLTHCVPQPMYARICRRRILPAEQTSSREVPFSWQRPYTWCLPPLLMRRVGSTLTQWMCWIWFQNAHSCQRWHSNDKRR